VKSWIALIALAACGHAGCDKSAAKKAPEDVKKEWSPKVQAKLEKIAAAAKATTSTSELGAPGDAKLGLDFDHVDAAKHPNAIAVQLDDAQLEPRPKPPTLEQQGAVAWANASEGKAVAPPGPSHPQFTFQNEYSNRVFEAKQLLGIEDSRIASEWEYDQLVNAKYLLVVVPGEVQWPSAEGSTLLPGNVPFRATLVEIDTAKPLGGFESAAHSSSEVTVKYDRDHDLSEAAHHQLEENFLSEYGKAVVQGIQQRWPDAKMPILAWGR